MGRVMSIVGVPMLLAPVLGPVIGGAIVQNLSWRWIFFVNLPVGIAGLLLARRLLPAGRAVGRASADGQERPVLDWRGLALVSPGVGAIVFGISEYGAHRTFATLSAWLPLALGVLAVVAFAVYGFRVRHPIIDVGLFRSGGFAAAAATVFLTGIALFGSMILLPLYYQIARGESPLIAGLLVAPQGLGAVIGMNLGGRATDRFGGGRVVIVGLLFLIAGTAIFTQVGPSTSYWLIGGALVLRGIGLGGAMMPAMAAAYATLKRNQVPRATPALNVLQRVGGSIGAALLIVILQNRIISSLGEGAQGGVSGGALANAARARVAGPLAEAFAHTYWYALALSAAALIPAVILAREERKTRRRSAAEVGFCCWGFFWCLCWGRWKGPGVLPLEPLRREDVRASLDRAAPARESRRTWPARRHFPPATSRPASRTILKPALARISGMERTLARSLSWYSFGIRSNGTPYIGMQSAARVLGAVTAAVAELALHVFGPPVVLDWREELDLLGSQDHRWILSVQEWGNPDDTADHGQLRGNRIGEQAVRLAPLLPASGPRGIKATGPCFLTPASSWLRMCVSCDATARASFVVCANAAGVRRLCEQAKRGDMIQQGPHPPASAVAIPVDSSGQYHRDRRTTDVGSRAEVERRRQRFGFVRQRDVDSVGSRPNLVPLERGRLEADVPGLDPDGVQVLNRRITIEQPASLHGRISGPARVTDKVAAGALSADCHWCRTLSSRPSATPSKPISSMCTRLGTRRRWNGACSCDNISAPVSNTLNRDNRNADVLLFVRACALIIPSSPKSSRMLQRGQEPLSA